METRPLTLSEGRRKLGVLDFFRKEPKRMKMMGRQKAIWFGVAFSFFAIFSVFASQPDPAAQAAYDKKDYKTAAEILEGQVAKTPADFDALVLLGSSYRNLGEFSKAEEVLTKALGQKSKDPSVLLELGHTQLALKKNKEALELFQKGLSTGKRVDEFYNGLGLAQFALGDGKNADLSFRQAIQKNPNVASYHKNLGDVYMASQIFSVAAEEYKAGLKYDSANVDLRYALSQAYRYQKNYNDAVEELKVILRQDSGFAKAYLDLGKLWVTSAKSANDTSQYKQGIWALLKYTSLDSTNAEVYLELTRAYGFIKSFDMVQASAQKALALNAKLCDAYFLTGQALQSSRRDSSANSRALEAFNQYEACLKQDAREPKDIEFFYRRGLAARALADSVHYVMARADFQKVRELNPNNTAVWSEIGLCEYYLKNFGAAIEAYSKRLAADPASPASANVYLNRGFTYYYGLKKYPEAVADFQRSLALKPEQPAVLGYLGEAYLQMKDYANAQTVYGQVLAKDSNDVDALKYVGSIYLTDDKPSQALPSLEKAWKQVVAKGMKPDEQTDLLTWLGQTYLKLKNFAKAKEFFQRCLDYDPGNKTCKENLDYLKELKGEAKDGSRGGAGSDGSGR